MKTPLYSFGMAIDPLLLSDKWDVEKEKSSRIEVIPEAGLIKKTKERGLDKTVREVFATIVFSELLKKYTELLRKYDFTLYSPQATHFEYGDTAEKRSIDSAVYEFFCPGTPLNKIDNARGCDYLIGQTKVRIGDRVSYLCGIMSELLLKEGIAHGDPQLRHFLLLPCQSNLKEIDRDNKLCLIPSRNGLGVIDPESSYIDGPYSQEIKSDVDKLKERLFKRFNSSNSEAMFTIGTSIIQGLPKDMRVLDFALALAYETFNSRFTPIKSVDMKKDGRVLYK
jgi:hypothetical protein